MRRAVLLGLAALVAACGPRPDRESVPPIAKVPATVACGDGANLRASAAQERERIGRTPSDQDKSMSAGRANFLASLANIADLQCRVPAAGIGSDLTAAFAAVNRSSHGPNFYAASGAWAEAEFLAGREVARLIALLPAPAAK